MKDRIIEIIKTMRGQSAIDDALGEKRCSFYLRDYADQLEKAIECEPTDCVEKTEGSL